MTSTMVVTQPEPVIQVQDSREWGSGICDCFQNTPECCFAFWLPPCFACRTARNYGECLCLPLLDWLPSAVPAASLAMRVSMRERYGIRGTLCRDCLYTFFCYSCSWCQMSREMSRRNVNVVLISVKNS
ncbi:cornifelin homolog B-like [Brachionichthys hirsutus]|uniref:cornifelin homolog B-like n=1 Tax=Brachionichthys hirsutus TaxID=412623 RepID=UPI00360502C5